MLGTMSKGDAAGGRSASLTFTIDSILNLKQREDREDGGDRGAAKTRGGDAGWRSASQAQCEETWEVRRGQERRDGTGNLSGSLLYTNVITPLSLVFACSAVSKYLLFLFLYTPFLSLAIFIFIKSLDVFN